MTTAGETMEGSCLCGKVRYRASGPIRSMGNCHCTDCRKSHGAVFATFICIPRPNFSFLQGEDRLTRHRADSGAVRSFCRECGSIITWEREAHAGFIDFTAATLDTPLHRKPEHHIFVRSKVPWYEIQDGTPQYPEHRVVT